MNDRPTAAELLEAVRSFVQDDVVAALDGPLKYHARVAANVLAIVARELECEDRHLSGEWERLGALLGDTHATPADRVELRGSIRKIILMQDKLERLANGLSAIGDQVIDHEKRLIRIETMIEVAQSQRNPPPKQIE